MNQETMPSAPKALLMAMPDVGTDEDFARCQAPGARANRDDMEGYSMNIADKIYETVKNLPERQAAEVLDFAEYLKAKLPTPPAPIPTDEAQQLRAELQAWVTSQAEQPENASEFIRRLRDEARY